MKRKKRERMGEREIKRKKKCKLLWYKNILRAPRGMQK
jgi:hypothetical protein